MYKITHTSLRYGEVSDETEYYARDESERDEIVTHLLDRAKNAGDIEYSLEDKPCKPTDRWDRVYWTFETIDLPKWGYTIRVKTIHFGLNRNELSFNL
jgi:hypothetical protein